MLNILENVKKFYAVQGIDSSRVRVIVDGLSNYGLLKLISKVEARTPTTLRVQYNKVLQDASTAAHTAVHDARIPIAHEFVDRVARHVADAVLKLRVELDEPAKPQPVVIEDAELRRQLDVAQTQIVALQSELQQLKSVDHHAAMLRALNAPIVDQEWRPRLIGCSGDSGMLYTKLESGVRIETPTGSARGDRVTIAWPKELPKC